MRRLVLCALLLASLPGPVRAATPPAAPPPGEPDYGLGAPLVEVDRFSDKAATRLRRSAVEGLPAPNQPIDLDKPPFRVEVTAPGGRTRSCYDLDLRPASAPPRIYAFYDASGSYILTQFPVIDVVPGDPGYSDVWEVFKVHAPPGFPADNSIRDAATVERLIQDPASGWTAEDTRILSNSPVVPAGSRAGMRADGRSGAAPLRYAWYRGRRAPFLYFEGSLKRGDATTAPVDRWTATSAAVPLGAAGAPAVGAVPGDTAYSPLHLLFDRDGRPLAATPLNCPIVGE